MGVEHCPWCGALYPYHRMECQLAHQGDKGPGGNPLALLLLPLLIYTIPFVVVLFPVASLIAIGVVMLVNGGVHVGIERTGTLWLALLVAFIPFLLALNVELRLERYRAYRIARHVVRVVGVPWLAAQYLLRWSDLIDSPWRAMTTGPGSLLGGIASHPGVQVTLLVLAVVTHLVGSGFDLSGRRPATWRDFLWPRESILAKTPVVRAVDASGSPARVAGRAPATLPRKLAFAVGMGFAIGVVATIVSKDYDSALLVILRVGITFSVVFGVVVVVHHALTRRRAAAR